MVSAVDTVIVVLTIALPLLYFYRESIPFIGGKVKSTIIGNGHANGSANGNGNGKAIKEDEGDPRDFVAKMEKAVSSNASAMAVILRQLDRSTESILIRNKPHPSLSLDRTNVASCFTVLKPVLQKNTPFV